MPMRRYVVRFITERELIEREYVAPTAQDCLDQAEAHFHTWNADHGELHEVVVCPPEGCTQLDEFAPKAVYEFYRLSEAGRRSIEAQAESYLAKLSPIERRIYEQQLAEVEEWRRQLLER